ncbi:MAG: ABC transporter ATP-binding protein, partial [Deltaproteobacteria bacterium]|nr:ABC transporter ATP-binding protein [Deltaproteobacteria bacterium]
MPLRSKIIARGVGKAYQSRQGMLLALRDFDLEVGEGEFVCLIGPSGCGKSTFLRILAGLYEKSAGEITVHKSSADKPLNSMVFQEYAIFPWRTVLDNVAFGLKMRGLSRRDRYEIADRYIRKVGLAKFRGSYPYQLSGGMKQRVSIARAFANDPEVLLMDEPFGALDAQTRVVLQEELLRIWEEDKKTVVYVTHSIEEAIMLGDRVAVMTARPGTNKEEFKVGFPRPRSLHIKGAA